jgi:hypothetical protein
MDSKAQDERERSKNNICSLEWIALAMDAARRHKEAERERRSGRDDREDIDREA